MHWLMLLTRNVPQILHEQLHAALCRNGRRVFGTRGERGDGAGCFKEDLRESVGVSGWKDGGRKYV